MKRRTALICALALGALPAFADDRVAHYAAEQAETLGEAMKNFSIYNGRMASVLARPSLTPNDMEDIHQLTYTLEAALDRMIKQATALADLLEEVHLASEGSDSEKLVELATTYLAIARQLVP